METLIRNIIIHKIILFDKISYISSRLKSRFLQIFTKLHHSPMSSARFFFSSNPTKRLDSTYNQHSLSFSYAASLPHLLLLSLLLHTISPKYHSPYIQKKLFINSIKIYFRSNSKKKGKAFFDHYPELAYFLNWYLNLKNSSGLILYIK